MVSPSIPQVHEGVFMVFQPMEVSGDTGCLSWLVLTTDKAESLQNAVCSPDKSFPAAALVVNLPRRTTFSHLRDLLGAWTKSHPNRGDSGRLFASGLHSCSI